MISVKNDHDYIHYEDVREAFGTVSLTSIVLNILNHFLTFICDSCSDLLKFEAELVVDQSLAGLRGRGGNCQL